VSLIDQKGLIKEGIPSLKSKKQSLMSFEERAAVRRLKHDEYASLSPSKSTTSVVAQSKLL